MRMCLCLVVSREEFKVEEINRAKEAKKEKTRLQVVMEWTGCSSRKDNAEIMETAAASDGNRNVALAWFLSRFSHGFQWILNDFN